MENNPIDDKKPGNPKRLARRRNILLRSAEEKRDKAKQIRQNPEMSIKPGFQSYALARRAKQETDLAKDLEKQRVKMVAAQKLSGKNESSIIERMKKKSGSKGF
jgi:hypothetical protein